MTFEEALGEQLRAKKRLTFWEKRLLKLIDARPSKRRTRVLERLRAHAATALEIKGDPAAIDWSKIDWAKVLDFVLKIILALLPLLL